MSHMESFQQLYQRACERKGGPEKLESMLLSRPKSRNMS